MAEKELVYQKDSKVKQKRSKYIHTQTEKLKEKEKNEEVSSEIATGVLDDALLPEEMPIPEKRKKSPGGTRETSIRNPIWAAENILEKEVSLPEGEDESAVEGNVEKKEENKERNNRYIRKGEATHHKYLRTSSRTAKYIGNGTVVAGRTAVKAAKIGAAGADILKEKQATELNINKVINKAVHKEMGVVQKVAKFILKPIKEAVAVVVSSFIHVIGSLLIALLPVVLFGFVVILVVLISSTSMAIALTPLRMLYHLGDTTNYIEKYIEDRVSHFWEELENENLIINDNEGDYIDRDNLNDIITAYISTYYDKPFQNDFGLSDALKNVLYAEDTNNDEETPEETDAASFWTITDLTDENIARADAIIDEMLEKRTHYEYVTVTKPDGTVEIRTVKSIIVQVHSYECYVERHQDTLTDMHIDNGKRLLEAVYQEKQRYYTTPKGYDEVLKAAIEAQTDDKKRQLMEQAKRFLRDDIATDPDLEYNLAFMGSELICEYWGIEVSKKSLRQQAEDLQAANLLTEVVPGTEYHVGDILYYASDIGEWTGITEIYLYVGNGIGITPSILYEEIILKALPGQRPVYLLCVETENNSAGEEASEESTEADVSGGYQD